MITQSYLPVLQKFSSLTTLALVDAKYLGVQIPLPSLGYRTLLRDVLPSNFISSTDLDGLDELTAIESLLGIATYSQRDHLRKAVHVASVILFHVCPSLTEVWFGDWAKVTCLKVDRKVKVSAVNMWDEERAIL